jgi:AcrR family transcriptional regulator
VQSVKNSSEAENKGGRPEHTPTERDRKTVEVLAGYAVTTEKIASVLGISKSTLLKHYASEIENGAARVESMLIGNLTRIASGSDGTALKAIMFALNCRFGWSAYAPRPVAEEPLGKKAQAEIVAQTAHEDSDWGQLVH